MNIVTQNIPLLLQRLCIFQFLSVAHSVIRRYTQVSAVWIYISPAHFVSPYLQPQTNKETT